MSMAEIIEELPKLSHQQRRELCHRIIAMEAQAEDLAACDQSAQQGFGLLDQMEAEDQANARRTQG
jgi:hypothetical protein